MELSSGASFTSAPKSAGRHASHEAAPHRVATGRRGKEGPNGRSTRRAAGGGRSHRSPSAITASGGPRCPRAPVVRAQLADVEYRLLSVAPVTPDVGDVLADASQVRATVYDYANDRSLIVEAPIDGSAHVSVTSTVRQPLPSGEEFAASVEALAYDPELGPRLRAGELRPYRPMPPLILDERPEGGTERTIALASLPRTVRALTRSLASRPPPGRSPALRRALRPRPSPGSRAAC
jgi:hypothetical protein